MDDKLISVIGTGECVVDLGCGSGRLLSDLADQFSLRIGLDMSKQRLAGTVDDWEFYQADLNESFPLEDGQVDVVIANQVIEHIIDPIRFAHEVHRILRPQGRCVITTPNIRYIKNIMYLLLSGYGPRTASGNTLDGAWDDGHIHYFTHRDLRELFSQVGFRQVQSLAFVDLVRGGLLRRLLDRHSETWLVREFLSGNILLWAER